MVDTVVHPEAGDFDITPASEHPDLPQADMDEPSPEGTPEPQEGNQSPTSHQRKKDANRRAAIKSRQKKVAQADAQRVTLKAFEDDNEALRREIRILMHASGTLSGNHGGMDHDAQIRHDQIEDEYNLPSHSFSHGHPFGGHGGEGEGVEGLLGLGAGLGDLANVAAAADQTSGFLQYGHQQAQGGHPIETGKDTAPKRSALATPTELAAAALRKSIQAHRIALQSLPDVQKQQEVEAQIEAVKAATVQKDKELAVLHGVLRRMTLARQQKQAEVNALREDLHQLIEDVGTTETGIGRQEKETEEVRRALREVRTYVETLVKQWKEVITAAWSKLLLTSTERYATSSTHFRRTFPAAATFAIRCGSIYPLPPWQHTRPLLLTQAPRTTAKDTTSASPTPRLSAPSLAAAG